MGRQEEHANEAWELPDGDALKELSPLPETRERGFFQRIVRQRAVYFADVEDVQDDGEDEDGIDVPNASEQSLANQDGGQSGDCLPPSAFADLSTWYCDAFLPARANFASLENRPTRLVPIVDQPTMAVPLLAPLAVHIADMPTRPNLSALSAPAASRGISSRRRAFVLPGGRLWGALARFFQRLLHACHKRARPMRSERKKRPPVTKGHELLMERLRERQERGISSGTLFTPSGERRYLPADRLPS